ncbi:uncharacterized protein NEMAJ01_2085 [Nematocida major]|uniref:uncharacterized protein n=1 Tax=Nematocida major TaxID=1912982 RepID=UPI002007EA9A|nr:uncharacterized protein NEMAJ01_2085 [Nematocida major]KAH9387189.1 hypothetical protein NEMAJ01_2085 [Nematocida major]
MQINVRTPPKMQTVLDAETDSGVYLEDWCEIERTLQGVLNTAHLHDFSPKSISTVVRGILSPDPRERQLYHEIGVCLLERHLIDRSYLVNAVTEYLLGEIPHYGIDIILSLLNKLGDIPREEISELYVPLLTRPLNIRIRREIIYGITMGYPYSALDFLFECLLRDCKKFDSFNSFVAVVIVEECICEMESVSKEACAMAAGILAFLLEKELHQVIKKVAEAFEKCEFTYKLSKNSQDVVEGLFDTVYRLSQTYWKKTEQFLVCQILQSLFRLNSAVFDESLQKYNEKVQGQNKCK